ncbi:hypothetical protein IAQ61_003232 [Plenodomus lingam]|uniref:Uncharacterized protein n=1 Tax=Leptosphaeria maculans (strain JN3 / isolate v23.1.3 / race Av1-4-5-6-7-8) TaxID=985895 RepID=E5ADW7_LEPMJ|nr:hypothetical protein LEMA_P001930.1 [Plenodomus lingam JN3]KAH9875768.1 hypothetical protein IAQ61_003232 [Plenodomus lingam]CBY01406.1 hypothetical protein LEMA_P001930.1 [Plenodomus lingam JN3]
MILTGLLLMGAVAAQSSTLYLNLLWDPQPTLTLVSSDATATTFEKGCPFTTTVSSTPSPTPTSSDFYDAYFSPAEESAYLSSLYSRFSREDSTALYEITASSEFAICIPFTLIQGPETWGFHLTNPGEYPGTKDGACTWKGAFTTAEITCTAEWKAPDVSGLDFTFTGPETITIPHEELRRDHTAFAVATIVNGQSIAASATPASVAGTGASPTQNVGPALRLTGTWASTRAAVGLWAVVWLLI